MTLYRRDGGSNVTVDLIVVLLVLIIVSIGCVGALWFLRRIRRRRESAGLLPMHNDNMDEKLTMPKKKGHRRLSGITISTGAPLVSDRRSSSKFVDEEKQQFIASTSPPPSAGNVPQIRITFPDETDTAGKRQSGRSVLIHVDDKGGIGMEPVHEDESLPPYEAGRFVSLDLDRMGGLKEKEHTDTKPAAA